MCHYDDIPASVHVFCSSTSLFFIGDSRLHLVRHVVGRPGRRCGTGVCLEVWALQVFWCTTSRILGADFRFSVVSLLEDAWLTFFSVSLSLSSMLLLVFKTGLLRRRRHVWKRVGRRLSTSLRRTPSPSPLLLLSFKSLFFGPAFQTTRPPWWIDTSY